MSPLGNGLLDQVLDLDIGLGRQHLVGRGRLHARQDAAAGPRIGRLGHRVRQPPDHVAPGDDLADVGLDAAERRGRPVISVALMRRPVMKSSFTARRVQPVDQRARQEAASAGKKLFAFSTSA